MSPKFIVLGGIAFFIVANIIGAVTGQLIHGPGGFLEPLYQAHQAMWRPELNQVPPDLAALAPLWVGMGLLNSLIVTTAYNVFAGALTGSPLANGLRFGAGASLIMVGLYCSYFGIFALPGTVWITWAIEGVFIYTLGGIALGYVARKFLSPVPPA